MAFGDGAFATAVRDAARLKALVLAGVVGAATVCTGVSGAMAVDTIVRSATSAAPAIEDSPDLPPVEQGALDLARTDTQIFLAGLNAIAGADLTGLPPREAVATIKSMARATLEANPGYADRAPPPAKEGVVRQEGRIIVNAAGMADFLGRVSERPLITAAVTQSEAAALVRRVRSDAAAAGADVGDRAFRFDGVLQEAERSVTTKRDVLSRIASLAAGNDVDVADLVELALEGQMERAPGERAYLRRMLDRAVADEASDPADRARAVASLSQDSTADGFLGRIGEMWKDQAEGLKADEVRIVALAGVRTLEGMAEVAERANAPSAPAP